jgi:hypothetical protein
LLGVGPVHGYGAPVYQLSMLGPGSTRKVIAGSPSESGATAIAN